MVSNRIIKIDLNKKTKNVVQMVQGDTNRKLTINVFDSDEPYLVDGVGGGTIHGAVYIEKPDGTTCGYDSLEDDSPAVTGSGNTLTVYFVPQATTAHGWAYMTVSIFDDEGVELNTFGIDLFIDKKATATISADYWNLKSIEGLTAAVEGLSQQMVRSVNFATPDSNGNVSLLPWQLPYNGVIGGQQVGDVEEALDALSRGSGLTSDIKTALLNCFAHVAWVDEHGQDYYDALDNALNPPANLQSITAVFNQGSAVIYEDDDLETLRQYLTVTALYSDTTTQTVTAYTLSGTLEVGTSTITVSYGGKTTTFNVTVTERDAIPSEYQKVEYIEATGNQYFRTGIVVGSSTMKILAKYYKQTQATKEEALICGEIIGSSAGYEIGFPATTNRLFAFSATSAVITDPLVYGNVNELEVDFNPSSPYATVKLTNGATELSASKTTANNSNIASSQLALFYTGTQITACSARLYYCKVYTDTNVLAFNGIPCYRKNNNIAGMYDTVSGTFFSSESSVQFLKGGDV